MPLEWIPVLVFIIAVAVGWGMVKINPLFAAILGIFSALIVVGLGLSAVFNVPFLLDFLMSQKWIIAGAFGYVAGGLIGLFT
ncbi:hypothetical protein CMI37_30045 [Candidatus Pacearchaeota archaeon]|nr:hypothetical protein [Candidatus Pacearchaeota archaeon]|tara:strand:+ start:8189 stop:8434 length:246 start_codon:yes stop_codon:yes gene_type:complete